MFSLFIYGTVLDDVTQCADAIRNTESMSMLALFIIFILISSFTILNMLIGILCEVVSATAESEKAKAAETSVKDAITSLFDKLDADGSGNITEEEFMHMKDDEVVLSALEEMDIYESHFERYCEILFQTQEDAGKQNPVINFDTLITMILRLSPGNHVNALDFSLLQASIDRTQESLRERILKIHTLIASQVGKVNVKGVFKPANSLQFPTMLEDDDGFYNPSSAGARSTAQGESAPPPPATTTTTTVP